MANRPQDRFDTQLPARSLILSEEDGKTTITNTVLYPSKEARDAALQTGMKEGMSLSFDRLAEYVQAMA